MTKRVNMDGIVAWMYVVECIDQRLLIANKDRPKLDGTFMRLMVDLIDAYPTELDAVLAVREALLGFRVDVYDKVTS
jgi:hypothetical protein